MNIIIPNGKCCEEVPSNMVVTTYAIDNLQSTPPPQTKKDHKNKFCIDPNHFGEGDAKSYQFQV